ncbi:MAG: hypothetical protein DBY42_06260 [Bacillota bacterium]|nr:MAG: hypothetical protein DBY42_06260 [Bacillota bacterium]
MERRITVFCGNFGSGKTELAYAYSKALRQGGEPVMLVDLDLVNPYFTSGNQRSALAEQGIRVIAPQYLGGDVPSIPPEVFSAFSGSGRVVFDLGGDPIGAVAMGSLAPRLEAAGGAEVLFVLNPYRPLVRDAQSAHDLMREIQEQSHLPCTAIINNANLGAETKKEHLMAGDAAAKELGKLAGLPVTHFGATLELLRELMPGEVSGTPILVEGINRPEWLV